MATVEHPVASEELMAYFDGELTEDRAAAVAAHLAQCSACTDIATALRQVSRDLAEWQVGSASSLKAPASPSRLRPTGWRWNFGSPRLVAAWSFAAAAVVVVVAVSLWRVAAPARQLAPASTIDVQARVDELKAGGGGGGGNRLAEPAPDRAAIRPHAFAALPGQAESPAQSSQTTKPVVQQKIVHTVELTIVAKHFDTVRPEIDRILQNVGGFVGQMDASGVPASINATLRVPADRLEEAVAALRQLGRVVHETRSADDVTEQSVDLEARLANSRNTEKRLSDVLRNRTGRVSDVLDVEREIARVREEIERLDAERTNLERRVSYATVTVHVSEERQATLEIGPVPLSLQMRNAFIDGVRDAFDGIANTLLWALRAGPVFALWTAILWWPVRRTLRIVRTRGTPRNAPNAG